MNHKVLHRPELTWSSHSSVDLKTGATNIHIKGHRKNYLGALKQSCEICLECLWFFSFSASVRMPVEFCFRIIIRSWSGRHRSSLKLHLYRDSTNATLLEVKFSVILPRIVLSDHETDGWRIYLLKWDCKDDRKIHFIKCWEYNSCWRVVIILVRYPPR